MNIDMSSISSQQNDKYFFHKPDLSFLPHVANSSHLSHSDIKSLTATIKDTMFSLKSYLTRYQHKLSSNPRPKLYIEVRKAQKVRYFGLCFNHQQVFAEVEFCPMHKFKVTQMAEPGCPAWFSLIKFEEGAELVNMLKFRLFQTDDSDKEVILGECTVEETDLVVTEPVEKRLKMGRESDAAELFVRIQAVKDPKRFYSEAVEYMLETIPKLKDAFYKCKILLGNGEINGDAKSELLKGSS
jgi:hypothetical protein